MSPASGVGPTTDGVTERRGQSEVVGMVLLLAIVVVMTMLIAWAILSAADTDDRPVVNLDVSVETNTVLLEHHGGDPLPADEVTVILRHDSVARHPLGNFTGLVDSRLDPGEVARHSHNATAVLRVQVIHVPSNVVLFDQAYDVPGP